ncbi:hypothetical protein EV361DRAFT_895997 [Lentinula raphanica]|nr:hypothetical protein EV361DRAFT_895997 [Lentinula raphanica]
MHKKPSGFLPPSLELVSPHSQPFLPCKRSKKQRRSTETSLHPHHIYYSPNLFVYSLVMTRFTFAVILVFLALSIAPEILAAPISVRRDSRDNGLVSRLLHESGPEKSNATIPEPTPFQRMTDFSETLMTASEMSEGFGDGGYTAEALKNFAEKFDKFRKEQLDLALKANDKEKAQKEILSFCKSDKRDLNQAKLDAKTLFGIIDENEKHVAQACQEQYEWLYNECVRWESGKDGTSGEDGTSGKDGTSGQDGTKKSG